MRPGPSEEQQLPTAVEDSASESNDACEGGVDGEANPALLVTGCCALDPRYRLHRSSSAICEDPSCLCRRSARCARVVGEEDRSKAAGVWGASTEAAPSAPLPRLHPAAAKPPMRAPTKRQAEKSNEVSDLDLPMFRIRQSASSHASGSEPKLPACLLFVFAVHGRLLHTCHLIRTACYDWPVWGNTSIPDGCFPCRLRSRWSALEDQPRWACWAHKHVASLDGLADADVRSAHPFRANTCYSSDRQAHQALR